ncbi:MAG: translation initiation factor [Bacteroidetes bacterium]|nr:translation initiation factor [Bacteroidota bacterium]
MAKKNEPGNRFVYSTDPDFRIDENGHPQQETLPPAQQKLKIRIDTKQRGGKAVSLVEGFVGKEEDLVELGKKLKTYCGTGGTVKENLIIIQGDQRDKLVQWLNKNGYTSSKKL